MHELFMFTLDPHKLIELYSLIFFLFFRVHHVLSALGLTHFLCYGSLWGQIRISRSLPWEADVEFCLLNEELAKYDEVFLDRTFKKHNLQLTYNSGEGLYSVKDPLFSGSSVQLLVFEEDPLVMYQSQSMETNLLICSTEFLSVYVFPSLLSGLVAGDHIRCSPQITS
jgi:hypothetical protein